MKEHMKDSKMGLIVILLIWGILMWLSLSPSSTYHNQVDTLISDAVVIQNIDKVGAHISLLEAIHGTNGIDYRYSVETDCPKWEFKTKYVTSTPIDWVDETSSVEVIIYDIQIRYKGTVYASGQYYTVPILDGISSESISQEEWRENLVKQAYQTFCSETDTNRSVRNGLRFTIIAIPVLLIIWILKPVIIGKIKKRK